MTTTDPITRAAESLWDSAGCPEGIHPLDYVPDARAALAAAIDRDEIAEVAMTVKLGATEGCDCDLPPMRLDDDAAFAIADAVIAHLTGANQ